MDNNIPELIVYYNHNYDTYGHSYMIYCKDGGRYLCSKKSSFRILDKRNSEDFILENIDAYAKSRGFYKALELLRKENSEDFYLKYESTKIPGNIRKTLSESSKEIITMCRRGINHDPYVIHFYNMINKLLGLLN